jgi:methylated-DNA-[protein]-cysteine S-methyltransferase
MRRRHAESMSGNGERGRARRAILKVFVVGPTAPSEPGMTCRYCQCDTAFGRVLLTSDGAALTGLYFEGQRHQPEIGADWIRDDAAEPFVLARAQLAAYARGERRRFELPLAPSGTRFQRAVWQALLTIEHGETLTYAALAARVGAPRAVRAVGGAVGRNPLSVVIPCHRVVGSDGSLTGYAGGLDRKRALLRLEGARVAGPAPSATRVRGGSASLAQRAAAF